jgi:hypothetical protein
LTQARETVWKDPNTNIFRWLPEEYRQYLERTGRINKSELSIALPNSSVIQIKGADNPDSLRGPKPQGVTTDEYGEIAKRWGAEFREAIIEPSLRISKGWAVYSGTPKGSNDLHTVLSFARNRPDWFGSLKTVDDTGIYTPEEIEEYKRNAVNLDFFYQEYYCQFLEGATSVFKGIDGAISGELEPPKMGETYTFGIDLARTFDNTAIVGFKNSDNHLVYYEKITDKTWDTQKVIINAVLNAYNAVGVIDATGVGDSFVEGLLKDNLNVLPVKIANNIIKRNLVERLATYIENRVITYPNIPEIVDELKHFEYKLTSRNNVVYSAPAGKHDDIVMAMALAASRLNPVIAPTAPSRYNLKINSRTGYLE